MNSNIVAFHLYCFVHTNARQMCLAFASRCIYSNLHHKCIVSMFKSFNNVSQDAPVR